MIQAQKMFIFLFVLDADHRCEYKELVQVLNSLNV